MSEFPSLPLFTDAYLADTRHLSAQEHGAYLLLLMMAWRQPECRVPNDDETLARWASVDVRTWKRIKPKVMAFWTLAEDQWSQSRLSREREFVSKRAEVARQNGKHGGRPKTLKTLATDNPPGSVRVTQPKAPSPSPSSIEPIAQRSNSAAPLDLLDKLLLANGQGTDFREEKNIGLMNVAPILGLLQAGYDLNRDVLPGISAKPNPQARTWSYFVPQIRDFAAKRDGIAAESKPIKPDPLAALASWPTAKWRLILDYARGRREWNREAYGPAPFEPDCLVPAELLIDTDRNFARAAA